MFQAMDPVPIPVPIHLAGASAALACGYWLDSRMLDRGKEGRSRDQKRKDKGILADLRSGIQASIRKRS